MTQQPSQNKQILAKLDELSEDMNELKVEVSSIKKQMEMQPKIDNSRFESIDKAEKVCRQEVDRQFSETIDRVKKLEENQRWLVIAVLGTVLNAVMQLILK